MFVLVMHDLGNGSHEVALRYIVQLEIIQIGGEYALGASRFDPAVSQDSGKG